MITAVVRGEVHQSVGLLPDLSDGLHDPADPLVHLPDGVPVAAVEATSPPPYSEMYQNIRRYKFQIGVLKKKEREGGMEQVTLCFLGISHVYIS